MGVYLARRLGETVLIIVGVTFVTFVLLLVIPADPARVIVGHGYATEQQVESIREQLGLNLPFYERYFRYLTALVQGDLGRSYIQKSDVAELIWSRLPATLLLIGGAIFFEITIGVTMGMLAAIRRNSRLDRALMVASFVIVSAPQFVVGILLLYVFAVYLGWFPMSGYGHLSNLVLPALTLGILGAAGIRD